LNFPQLPVNPSPRSRAADDRSLKIQLSYDIKVIGRGMAYYMNGVGYETPQTPLKI